MRVVNVLATAAVVLAGHAVAASAQEMAAMDKKTQKEMKVKSAMAAGPAALAKNATIVDWDQTVLKEGTNGWTCFPDPPDQPGETPMCLDQQWMKWADAWMNKKPETGVTQIGIGYMMQGGWDASNTDPYAAEPAPGQEWVESGPHLMIITPDPKALANLPTDYTSGGPWVMWQGTHLAHIMIPLMDAKTHKEHRKMMGEMMKKEHKH